MNQATETNHGGQQTIGTTCDVVFKGLQPNVSPDEAIAKLAVLFNTTIGQIDKLLAMPNYVLKKSISFDAASKYRTAIETAGGVCDLVSDDNIVRIDVDFPKTGEPSTEKNARPDEPILGTSAAMSTHCQKCGFALPDSASFCRSCGTPTSTINTAPVPTAPTNPTSIQTPVPPPQSGTNQTKFNAANSTFDKPTENAMSNISEIKEQVSTGTLNFVLLSIATVGIYPILWLNKNYPTIDGFTKTKTIDQTFIIWLAVCLGMGGAIQEIGIPALNLLGSAIIIAANVLYIVWAFKAKKALEEYALNTFKIDLRMNAFYTILFTVFYINYCINDLPEVQRKQQILRGQS